MAEAKKFLTIKANGNNELIIKKSRFITTLVRTNTVQEAEKAIIETTKKYRDATHNTFAYTIGLNDEHVKASDNGEPAGTAGVPELKALQLMSIKNVTAIVTRYFGGTKLGAGGLIRAYSNSVTKGIEAIGVVKCVLQQELIFHVDYKRLDEVNHFLSQAEIFVKKVEYGIDIVFRVFIDENEQTVFEKKLTNLLNEKITISTGQKRYNEILVADHNYREK